MNDKKISIIVPVYNVSKYVRKCISSIVKQLNETVELVIVNDGTPDDSIGRIQDILEEYKNIILINQDNQGLSGARNTGLDKAKGDYVWFVDSDDWIASNAIETILQYVEKYPDIDVLLTDIISVDETDEKEADFNCGIIRDEKISGSYIIEHAKFRTPIQRYIIKRTLLTRHNLTFIPHVYHEDIDFSLRLLYYVKSAIIVKQPLYYYLLRFKGSITSVVNQKHIDDIAKIIKNDLIFVDKINSDIPIFKRALFRLSIFMMNAICKTTPEVRKFSLCKYRKFLKEMSKKTYKNLLYRDKLLAILLLCNPSIYVWIKNR